MSFNCIPLEQENIELGVPSFNWFSNTLQFIETIKNLPSFSITCLEKEDDPQPKNIFPTVSQDLKNKLDSHGVDKKTKKSGCNCSKTNCQKRYCECFNAGKPCTSECVCYGCLNDHKHESSPNKNAMVLNAKGKSKGCNCKKSQCRKKYCECFNAGIGCTGACQCVGCENQGSQCDSHCAQSHPQSNTKVQVKNSIVISNLGNKSLLEG